MKMHIKKISLSMAALSLVMPLSTLANAVPGSFMTEGGIEITPTLQAGISSNSNFFSTPENKESRVIWTIAPNVVALLEDGPDFYSFSAGTSTALHNIESVDNFTQINLVGELHKEFTSKHRINLHTTADWMSEPRGSGLSEGLGDAINSPIEYQQQNVLGYYEFGAESSFAQIRVSAGLFNKEYKNFRAISKFRDFNKSLIAVTGYYNTQSATKLFLELKNEAYRYDYIADLSVSRDSDDVKALLGVEWEASAITTGSFKIGYQQKDFVSATRENFSGLSWEAQVSWQPLSYSTLQLNTSRAAKDPLVEGDYIRESVYGASWTHNWSDTFSSLASLNYIDEQYTGDITREDTSLNARLGINYVTTDFGTVSTYIDFLDKESSQEALNFDRYVIGINFTFALKAN